MISIKVHERIGTDFTDGALVQFDGLVDTDAPVTSLYYFNGGAVRDGSFYPDRGELHDEACVLHLDADDASRLYSEFAGDGMDVSPYPEDIDGATDFTFYLRACRVYPLVRGARVGDTEPYDGVVMYYVGGRWRTGDDVADFLMEQAHV